MQMRARRPVTRRAAALLVAAVSVSACNPLDPLNADFDALEPAVLYEAKVESPAPTSVATVRAMTWNIKYAGARILFFFECNGERSLMTKEETVENLENIAAFIKFARPDILLLQEIDVLSKRTAYVDNVQWLLNHTHFNHGAYASHWKIDYVPSDGIGRIDSGNAILSRWPFLEAERLAMPLIDAQDAITRYFYLRRNILRTSIDLPDADDLSVINVHTAAFAEDDTKRRQINLFKTVLDEVAAIGRQFIAGGDLNSVPPGTTQLTGYADNCDDARFDPDDYSGEESWLDELYSFYAAAIPAGDYRADNARYFTFTGDEDVGWTRKLDYLFTNERFEPSSGVAHQSMNRGGYETLPLSDHAPLSVDMVLRR
ncbi:MAG: endonuclease/exonuclease/phosphatase family protein [Myxococcota bacterium]